VSGDDDRPRPKLIEKLQERRDAHRARSRVIRALYAAVGVTLLLAGLIMLVTPGPAFAIIPVGLFILALEFSWAESALERSLEQAEAARRKAAETSRTQRILSATAGVLAVAGLVAWALYGDIPLAPV
jgi:uncharacterized protein (TIGR02611 family)